VAVTGVAAGAVAGPDRPTALPARAVGLSYRPVLRTGLFLSRERVDCLEVIAEHYLDAPAERLAELDLLAAHFPLLPHGLGLSLGSAAGPDPAHLAALARLIRRLDPPFWSEHLAFTRAGGVNIGHLAPLPFTHEAVAAVVRNVQRVRAAIDTPLVLENISYLVRLPDAQMDEADFLAEVAEGSGCGLLLDVANLHCNAMNHGYDPIAFLDRLPLERVMQVHLAGGVWDHGTLLDTHTRPTPPPVWTLLQEVLARCAPRAVILERDANFPPFEDLLAELDQAREMMGRHDGP
jgi:uncharacterized protein (UPF0276 family)